MIITALIIIVISIAVTSQLFPVGTEEIRQMEDRAQMAYLQEWKEKRKR